MPKEVLERIDEKLDSIMKLLANKLIEGKSQKNSILTLGDLGFDRNLISKIVSTSPKTVSNILSEARRKKKSKRKKVVSQEGKQNEQ